MTESAAPFSMDDLQRMFEPAQDLRPKTTILPEAAMMELESAMGDFIVEEGRCRFKVGDTVIPKRNGLVMRQDELPRKIVAVRPDAPYDFSGEPGGVAYGMRSDIRVLCFHGQNVLAFWTESSYYEFYQPKE